MKWRFLLAAGCTVAAFVVGTRFAPTSNASDAAVAATADAHASHASMASAPAAPQDPKLPADGAGARARLAASPRHGEYQMIKTSDGDSIKAWVVYPQRSTKAPVVLVVHEIFGLSTWVRGVADQLAAEGFIAIAPDLLTTKNIPVDSIGDPVSGAASAAIRSLDRMTVHRQLHDVAAWGMKQPAALAKYGIVGFCWGGGAAIDHAIAMSDVSASVIYYGSPGLTDFAQIRAPILGLYGGADARISAAVPALDSTLTKLGKTYEPHIFDGAGHGFLRQQSGLNGANAAAASKAWPLTVQWFRKHLS